MNDQAERVYHAFRNLEEPEQKQVLKQIEADAKFAKTLDALGDIYDRHGEKAARCVLNGDLEGAKAAALENARQKVEVKP